MKKTYTFLILAAVMLFLKSCSGERYDISEEYSRKAYTPSEALGFTISAPKEDSNRSLLINVTRAWQGEDSMAAPRRLLLLRGGAAAPREFRGQCLRDSAERIVAMSSSHIAMLDAIGATDKIVGVSGTDYISNSSLQARRSSLADVGYEGNVDYEALVGAHPDLVLLYGLNGASPMEKRLEQLGIPYIYIGDYTEQSPTGKAEWVVVLAEITGRGQLGRECFRLIKERYDSVASNSVQAKGRRPRVMLNTPYSDTWFMPPADSYAVRLIEDAGGEYVYTQNKSGASVPVDIEEAYILASGADIWINTGTASTAGELLRQCPKFADVPAVRSGRVYNNTLRVNAAGGNDYWESGVMQPDLILSDLIKIFSETPPDSIEGLNYYQRVK